MVAEEPCHEPWHSLRRTLCHLARRPQRRPSQRSKIIFCGQLSGQAKPRGQFSGHAPPVLGAAQEVWAVLGAKNT
eukprot:4611768-Prymnesium_polylepis.1